MAISSSHRKEKASAVIALANAGTPVRRISELTGYSGSGVAKILRRHGVTGVEQTAARIYGCGVAQAVALNGGERLQAPGSMAQRYRTQRISAGKRGIQWEITFPEWMAVWLDSGKLEQRGVGASKYCMARHGDTGPYKVGNVSIQTNQVNGREGIKKAHATMRIRNTWGRTLGTGRGWTFLPNARKKPYQVVVGPKYIGTYATRADAEAAYAAAVNQIKDSIHG